MVSETEFTDYLEKLLRHRFGSENVRREVTLRSRRRVDLMLNLGLTIMMIEAENDTDSVIDGYGQAKVYSSHDSRVGGAVMYPLSEYDEDLEFLNGATAVIPVEYKPEDLDTAIIGFNAF